MNGLVKRLREASSSPTRDAMGIGEHWNLEDEAADEIERKDAAIAELVGALRRLTIAKNVKDTYGDTPEYRSLKGGCWESARELIAKYDTIPKET